MREGEREKWEEVRGNKGEGESGSVGGHGSGDRLDKKRREEKLTEAETVKIRESAGTYK